MSAPVLAFRNPEPPKRRRAPSEPSIVRKAALLARVSPVAADLIEETIDDLLAQYADEKGGA